MRAHASSEVAVTPVVGTILLLGIGIAGMAVVVLLGAPALDRLREQAQLEAMVAQLETMRDGMAGLSVPDAGASYSISLPGGRLAAEPGTRWLVTISKDTSALHEACDFRVLAWADGDAQLLWPSTLGTACRTPAVDVAGDNALVNGNGPDCYTGDSGATVNLGAPLGTVVFPALACFEAAKTSALGTNLATSGGSCIQVPSVVAQCSTGITLSETVDRGEDWRLRLTNGQTGAAETVYWEAWLLHTDRIHWDGGSVFTSLEAGAVMAGGPRSDVLTALPRVDEGAALGDPVLLVLPMMDVDHATSFEGGSTHSFQATLNQSVLRHQGDATRVRIDLQGSGAELLCSSFLQRDTAPTPWLADGADGACGLVGNESTDPVAADDTYSVRFDPAGTFPVVLTHLSFQLRMTP
jgi:hypothetical protein